MQYVFFFISPILKNIIVGIKKPSDSCISLKTQSNEISIFKFKLDDSQE
jgi:hypothetical protein